MAVSVFFVGCSPKGLSDNPPTDANVISNGGMTVVKDNYLYFVNGYVDDTTLDGYDNQQGKVTRSAIYRTKLVDGKIQKDKDGFLTNSDIVVSKVVGFDNGGFFIIDDYIYYATPYMKYDREGTLQSSRVEFHKVNINGTKDKTLYVTEQGEDNLDWTVYKCDGTVYIVTYVNSKIVIVNTSNTKDVKTVENSTSYSFLHETDYATNSARNSVFQNYIYYTRAVTDDDGLSDNYKGNIMCRINVATGDIDSYAGDRDSTYSVVGVTEEKIYYTKTNATGDNRQSMLHQRDLSQSSWVNATEVKLANMTFSNYYICKFGIDMIIADDGNGTYVLEEGTITKISSSQKTVIGMNGDDAYYVVDNVLFKFNVRDTLENGEISIEQMTKDEDKTHLITNSKFWDFDNQRVYVYTEYTNEDSYYLNYIEGDSERFVGVFEEDDLPAEPEQDEDYGTDESVAWIPRID